MVSLPLDGVRVVDFTWLIAGPYATQWLSVMGAEVIRIESSQHVDLLRRQPPFADGLEGENRCAHWNAMNLGKLSCTLNLAKPKAVDLVKQIVRISDVVVENFAYGQLERFGLGYAGLRELKPDLILVSSSGIGRTGPERTYVAYNEQLIAYSGLASLTGYAGAEPVYGGGFWADHLSATTLAFAILAALHYRARTGHGQDVDISMTEALMSQLPQELMDYTMNQRVGSTKGNRDEVMAPHGVYPCQGDDQWVGIAVASEEEWHSLCKVMGDPSWAQDVKFADRFQRWQHQDELDAHIGEWTKRLSAQEVMDILQGAGVAAGPLFGIEDIVGDRHLRERGAFIAPDHLELGKRELQAMPCKLSAHPDLNYAAPPVLGQHNEYVFLDLLGLADEEFANLIGEGVIV